MKGEGEGVGEREKGRVRGREGEKSGRRRVDKKRKMK